MTPPENRVAIVQPFARGVYQLETSASFR